MKYLSPETLKVFLNFLYSTDTTSSSTSDPLSRLGKFVILSEIYDNNLGGCFYFRINEEKTSSFIKDLGTSSNSIYKKDTFESHIKKIKNAYFNKKEIEYKDLVSPFENFIVEDIMLGHLYDLNFKKSEKKKLLDFLKHYIMCFKEDSLISDTNFYSFKINLDKTLEIFKSYFECYGSVFNISFCSKQDLIEIDNEEEGLRFYEIIFYLIFKKYIEITSCEFFENEDKLHFNIRLKLIISPSEIKEIKNSTATYGDLSLNSNTGLVIYKDRKIKFRTDSRTFKLLTELIKRPGKNIIVKDIYKLIDPQMANVKDIARNDVREIKRKLGFSKDSNRTIQISFYSGDYLILKKI